MRGGIVVAALVVAACGGNPPPPPANHKIACDKLDACGLSSSGFSCDGNLASACGQCINAAPCGNIIAGGCAPPCPGVTFKVK